MKKPTLSEFKKQFEINYPHISHSLSDKAIQKWLDKIEIHGKVDNMFGILLDLFSDYILSQDLADEVQP